jgi:PTS system mannose-specific IIA component
VEALRADAQRVIAENQEAGKETIVLVDIFGGSPSNVALYALRSSDTKLITGVNMLMLIEFFSSRDSEELSDLVEKMIASSVEGIKKFERNN